MASKQPLKFFTSVFDFFSSIKLAVILILSIGTFLGYGTFYESAHGTQLAQKLVYHSPIATLLMAVLVLNLACAAIDRLPWKKHHVGFVITHLGIIVMIFGSFITQQRGVEGIAYLPLNESAGFFTVDSTELRIYQSFDGRPFVLVHSEDVDFDRKPPSDHPYTFKLVDDDVLTITDYHVHAIRNVSVTQSQDKTNGLPAFKFKMSNPNVSVEEWVGLTPELKPFYDFGPALVTFIRGPIPIPPEPKNQIVISEDPATGKLSYAIFSKKSKSAANRGMAKVNEDIQTGWMGLTFKVLEYIPRAAVKVNYEDVDHNDPNGNSVITASIGDHQGYFELDSPHEIRGATGKYFVSFIRKRYDLGFKLFLKKFKMGIYGGSTMPSSYQSTVSINSKDAPDHEISMNEPLKQGGYTLYQSSFEQNERGEPIASVLSVNYDPGRWIKYLGAILIVAGIATMFYLKPRWTRKKREA